AYPFENLDRPERLGIRVPTKKRLPKEPPYHHKYKSLDLKSPRQVVPEGVVETVLKHACNNRCCAKATRHGSRSSQNCGPMSILYPVVQGIHYALLPTVVLCQQTRPAVAQACCLLYRARSHYHVSPVAG